MVAGNAQSQALGDVGARNLADVTKTVPQMATITPRWLVHMLAWVPVEAGIYRVNKVKHPEDVDVVCSNYDESPLPTTFVDYEENPREYVLNSVSTILDVHTRVSDLYSRPHDQIKEQLRLTIETIKEHQEAELIISPNYGLLANVADAQRFPTLAGPPTPDDLDRLISKVWKEPAFFLTHPEAIAAFGRECTQPGGAAAHREPVRLTVPDLAGAADHPVGQGPVGERQDQGAADPHRGGPAGCGGFVSAGAGRGAGPWPVRAVHGHRSQCDRVVPGVVVLLARGAHRRCARGAGRCRGRQVP